MKRTTFINKSSSAGDPSRLTPYQRRQVNERSREYRQANRNAAGQALSRTASPVSRQATPEIAQMAGGADPFDTVKVPFNATVIMILRYYKDVHYTRLWWEVYTKLDGRVEVGSLAICTPERVIMESLNSESRMRCLLADAGSHLARERSDLDIEPFALLQRGTTALRDELNSKGIDAGEEALYDALHLYLAAAVLQEAESLVAHIAGIRAIIANIVTRGTKIGRALAALLSLVDVNLSQELLEDETGLVVEMQPQAGWVQVVPFRQLKQISWEARPSMPAALGL